MVKEQSLVWAKKRPKPRNITSTAHYDQGWQWPTSLYWWNPRFTQLKVISDHVEKEQESALEALDQNWYLDPITGACILVMVKPNAIKLALSIVYMGLSFTSTWPFSTSFEIKFECRGKGVEIVSKYFNMPNQISISQKRVRMGNLILEKSEYAV